MLVMRVFCIVGLLEFKSDKFIMGIMLFVFVFIFSMGCWFFVLMNMGGSFCILCMSVNMRFLFCMVVLVFDRIVFRFVVLCVCDGRSCGVIFLIVFCF